MRARRRTVWLPCGNLPRTSLPLPVTPRERGRNLSSEASPAYPGDTLSVHARPGRASSAGERGARHGVQVAELGGDRQLGLWRLREQAGARRADARLAGQARQLDERPGEHEREQPDDEDADDHRPASAPRASVLARRSSTATGRVRTWNPASSKPTRASSDASGRTTTTTGTPRATRPQSVACSPPPRGAAGAGAGRAPRPPGGARGAPRRAARGAGRGPARAGRGPAGAPGDG